MVAGTQEHFKLKPASEDVCRSVYVSVCSIKTDIRGGFFRSHEVKCTRRQGGRCGGGEREPKKQKPPSVAPTIIVAY